MTDFAIYSTNANLVDSSFREVKKSGTIQYNNTVLQSSQNQDSVTIQTDTSHERPTPEEIRNWKWQQDKKMYITDSNYIPRNNDVGLNITETTQNSLMVLPIREINRYNKDWLTIALLLAVVLLATVRVGYAKYIGSLFQSVINYSTSFRMFRERNYSILHGASRLEALYYVVFSVFIFQLLIFLSLESGSAGLILYGKTLGFVILYFMLKKFIYKLLGTIFNGVQEASEFIFNINNFNRVTGIILFPIVALLAFYPYGNIVFIVILGVLAVGGLYLFLLQRGMLILLKKQFSIFYLFLYLCILEFLPLLLIYKVVAE